MDFTVREYGLQIDQPPAIGNLSSLMVIIQKNDNAEGILEFDPKYVNITGTFIPRSFFFFFLKLFCDLLFILLPFLLKTKFLCL